MFCIDCQWGTLSGKTRGSAIGMVLMPDQIELKSVFVHQIIQKTVFQVSLQPDTIQSSYILTCQCYLIQAPYMTPKTWGSPVKQQWSPQDAQSGGTLHTCASFLRHWLGLLRFQRYHLNHRKNLFQMLKWSYFQLQLRIAVLYPRGGADRISQSWSSSSMSLSSGILEWQF